jgi:DMSO/TMAO reductase YedYZ molybdopterin-dependent catalytic subunit
MEAEGRDLYYESIDMEDAHHPQTLLAYELNGETLPVANGAPVRLRVERQLGYKMAKYVMRIELVESFAAIGGGKGGSGKTRATSGTRESSGNAGLSATGLVLEVEEQRRRCARDETGASAPLARRKARATRSSPLAPPFQRAESGYLQVEVVAA